MFEDYASIKNYPMDKLQADATAWQQLDTNFAAQVTDYQQQVQQKVDDGTWHGQAADSALPVIRQTLTMLEGTQNYLKAVSAGLAAAVTCYGAAQQELQGAADAVGESSCGIDGGGNVTLPGSMLFDWDYPPILDGMKAQWQIYEARYMAYVTDKALTPILNCADKLKNYASPTFLTDSAADLAAATTTTQNLGSTIWGIPNDFGDIPPDTAEQPYHVAAPTQDDHDTWDFMGMYGRTYFEVQGWSNANNLLTHWLQNSGGTYNVDPMAMMNDMPAFKQVVNSYFQGKGDGLYDSGWLNFDPSEHGGIQSEDWYYAFNDFRYRVIGVHMTDGEFPIVDYTVGIKKPYVFGPPRHDISHFGITITQAQLEHLHTTGLARNFVAVGIAQAGDEFFGWPF